MMIRRCILMAAAGALLASHAMAQAAPASPYSLSVAVLPSRSEACSHVAPHGEDVQRWRERGKIPVVF
jgi:hypothetical protein